MKKTKYNSIIINFSIIFLIVSLNSCNSIANKAATRPKTKKRVPATTEITINYPEIFKASREILKQDLMTSNHNVKKVYKNLPESLLIENLQAQNRELPETLSATTLQHEVLIELLKKESSQTVDPSKHLRLIPPKGMPGYSDLQFYSSHPYSYIPEGQKLSKNIPQSNLVEIWKAFLAKAEKQIVLNVYDFDLETIAETLIEKGQKGLQVRVGIDKSVIANRPEVKKIFETLNKSGVVQVTAVDSIGLNHQKITAIDWDYPNLARVLFSSGNLTQSCLDPEGDIKNIQPHPEESIPNANHLITMRSWLLANLVNHELSKTLDPEFQLRGAQYPLTGAYQVTGPEIKDPENLFSEPRPLHSLIISFTPGGGYKNVNSNLIARLISENNGPLRLIQFAFSSSEVGALAPLLDINPIITSGFGVLFQPETAVRIFREQLLKTDIAVLDSALLVAWRTFFLYTAGYKGHIGFHGGVFSLSEIANPPKDRVGLNTLDPATTIRTCCATPSGIQEE